VVTILNVAFFILLLITAYAVLFNLHEKDISKVIQRFVEEKNKSYFEKYSKSSNRRNGKVNIVSNYIYKITHLFDMAGIKQNLIINPIAIIVLCGVSFVVCFCVAIYVFNLIPLSLIISLPGMIIPVVILQLLAKRRESAIENSILDLVLQLRNLTRINNDIVYALGQVKTISPLQDYIDEFLSELHNGIKFEFAVEKLKLKLSFKVLRDLFDNISHCYIFGGDYQELMRKSYVMISKVQKEKKDRKNETRSARIVLGILIFLDLFVYFTYIKNNYENYVLMSNQLLGQIIIYWNFISIWFLFILMRKVQRLDY
jgi:Flp pilus assembly protein TadB